MTETTIILELTPREASAIFEMVLTYNWERGPFGHDVRNIYYAMDKVCGEFLHINSQTFTQFGELEAGSIWLDGTECDESVED